MSNYMDDLHTGSVSTPTIDTLEKAAQISPYHMTKEQALLYITSCVENNMAAHVTFYAGKRKDSPQDSIPEGKMAVKDYKPGCIYCPMIQEMFQDVIVFDSVIYLLDWVYIPQLIQANERDWWFVSPSTRMGWEDEQNLKKQLEKAAKEW